jgi:hypothetical protein
MSVLPSQESKRRTPTRHPDCQECQRLWPVYADATFEHIRIDSRLRLVALEHDIEKILSLTIQVESAKIARAVAREAVRNHEAEAHPDVEAATAS